MGRVAIRTRLSIRERLSNPDKPAPAIRETAVGLSYLDFLILVGLLVVVIVIWQIVITLFNIPEYILATPLDTARKLGSLWDTWLSGTEVTLAEILLGFAVGIVTGIGCAILVTWSSIARRIVYPAVVATQAIPKVAIAPLLVVWFGLGPASAVVLSAVLAFFPVLLNTTHGFDSVDPAYILMARAAQASAPRIFWKIRMSIAAPSIFTGLRLGVTLAAIGAIVGEFIVGTSGLGSVVQAAQSTQENASALAGVFVIAVVTTALFYIVAGIERLVVKGPR